MTIAYVNAGAIGSSGGVTSQSVGLPSSRVNGNLLIAAVASQNNTTHTWPGGWNVIEQGYNGTFTSSIAWRIVDGSESSPNVTWTGSAFGTSLCWQYSAVLTSTPIGDTTKKQGNASPHSSDQIETIGKNSLAVYFDLAPNTTLLTNPSGWTNNIANNSGGYAFSVGSKQLTGGVGTFSGDTSSVGSSGNWTMRQLELVQEIPPPPIDADADSTADGSTTTEGAFGIASPASSTAEGTTDATYIFAVGVFATSSADLQTSVEGKIDYGVTGSSTGVLSSPSLVVLERFGNAESEAEVSDEEPLVNWQANGNINTNIVVNGAVIGTRLTYNVTESTLNALSSAIGSQTYEGITISTAELEGDAEVLRSISAIVISNGAIASQSVANAVYGALASSIAEVMDGVAFINDYWDGWAYNLNIEAASFYEQYKFNSFAKFCNGYYGMNDDGIHLLTGPDDNGADIDVVIKTGLTDFDDMSLKTIPVIYAGARSDKEMQLTVSTDDNPDYSYQFIGKRGEFAPVRVKIGRGIKARYWQIELRNRDGAHMELDELDIPEVSTSRRV